VRAARGGASKGIQSRAGKEDPGTLLEDMPWPAYRMMTDDDIRAVYEGYPPRRAWRRRDGVQRLELRNGDAQISQCNEVPRKYCR
jgi:hypothetical protein